MEVGHWEIYISRDRISGSTPWAIASFGKSKMNTIYVSDVIIMTRAYTGRASAKDRPQFVIHTFGRLRKSGNVVYIEDENA
jgi:hypothetical protein